jgi:outer membrane protein assembly factor BamB
MGGFHGPAIGYRLGGSGDVTSTNRLWHHTSKNPQRVGSGVIVGNHVYIANEIGLVQCFELATGKELWREPVRAGKSWSSMIAADGRLYYSTQQGTTVVLAPNPERLEVLAENQLGEGTNSTIAVSNGQIFLRTYEHLWCIGPSR